MTERNMENDAHAPTLIDVTPDNVCDEGLYCLKNPAAPGFQRKVAWFRKRHREGLRLKILHDRPGSPAGFIEYVPAEHAWRPVDAPNYLFIHCVFVTSKKHAGKGFGSLLVQACERDARDQHKAGICVMTSAQPWMANATLFTKNGFTKVHERGRFQLLAKKIQSSASDPRLRDWESRQKKHKGWHLVYADQCPWHEKAAVALAEVAADRGVDLTIKKLTTARQAQAAPSGFGVFSLLRDGRLLEDHYISATRFRNILAKELRD